MSDNQKMLITGALGFIGKSLSKELKKRGYEVFGCDLYHSCDPNYFRCDIGKYRQIAKIFEKQRFDYVYNLAAEFGRWNGEDFYENLWLTNVIGTKNIIRLQEKYHFRLIHSSSSEVYGDYNEIMSEDVMDKYEIKQLNDYAMTKWVNEMQILNSASQFNTETVRVRLFNFYGPGEYYSQYRSALCRFVYCALNKTPFVVYKGHTRSWLFIEDACKTLANIVGNFKAGEVYNIASSESVSIEDLVELILKKANASENLATRKDKEPFTTAFKKVDISKAKKELNHNPQTSLEEGIEKTINWMKEIYKL